MFSKIFATGRLSKDPEWVNQDQTVLSINIACSPYQSETVWHRITVFGELAQRANKILKKGTCVNVVANTKVTKVEKDGESKLYTNHNLESFELIPMNSQKPNKKSLPSQMADSMPTTGDIDDDIPF